HALRSAHARRHGAIDQLAVAGMLPAFSSRARYGRYTDDFSYRLKVPVRDGAYSQTKGNHGDVGMLQDSWCFYEERIPKKRIFHPRKRNFFGPLLTVAAAVLVVFEAVSRL